MRRKKQREPHPPLLFLMPETLKLALWSPVWKGVVGLSPDQRQGLHKGGSQHKGRFRGWRLYTALLLAPQQWPSSMSY